MFSRLLAIIWIAAAGGTLAWGWPYYILPTDQRAYSDLHDMFSPTGSVGLLYGLIGTACILVGVILYVVRKRISWLRTAGALNRWLQVHIFLCTIGPFLILLHTSFKFGGVVAIAFWSMMLVAGSGIFGRYVFARLPRTIHGHARSLESVKTQKNVLIHAISRDAGVNVRQVREALGIDHMREPTGILSALVTALRYDIANRLRRRRIKRFLIHQQVPKHIRRWMAKLLQDQLVLEQQILLLKPFQRIFHLWHLMHLPLSLLMFVIVAGHIALAVIMGYAWPA